MARIMSKASKYWAHHIGASRFCPSSVGLQLITSGCTSVPDVQAAWLILLHCAQARANYLVRVVRPDAVRSFAQRHGRPNGGTGTLSDAFNEVDKIGASCVQDATAPSPPPTRTPVPSSLPVWPSTRPSGHHRAACARAGVLGRRGFALESAAARVCREAGGRVRTNLLMREEICSWTGCRCLEDARSLWTPRWWEHSMVTGLPDGDQPTDIDWHFTAARKRKEDRYPELVGARSRTRLVVLASEVGGSWSVEASSFVSQLAVARARLEVPLLRKRAQQAWRLRWSAILACASGRAVAESLLGLSGSPGCDGLSHH